jgi:tetratricopeptide (TPR) repeat protein
VVVRRLPTLLLATIAGWGVPPAARSAAPSASAPSASASVAATLPASAEDPVIRFLEERVATDALDPAIVVRLGGTCLQQARETGDVTLYAKAEAAFQTALTRTANYFPALTGLGTTHLGQHRFREALVVADRAVAQRPDAPEAHALRGDACLELGDLAEAEAAFKRMHALRPGLLSHARLANLSFVRGEAPAAIEQYEAALRAGEQAGAAPALRTWCLVRLGEVHFRTGKWDGAQRRYASAAALQPDDVALLDHLAELQAARGEYGDAIATYEQVVARSPRPEFFHALGDVCARARKPNDAQRWHEQALAGYLRAAAAGNAGYYHHLADFYCEVRPDGAEALKWATKDLALRRTTASLAALARAHYVAGDDAAAAAAMDEALARPTADFHVLSDATLIYARAARPADALACRERTIKANPKFNAFHVHR